MLRTYNLTVLYTQNKNENPHYNAIISYTLSFYDDCVMASIRDVTNGFEIKWSGEGKSGDDRPSCGVHAR